MLFLPPLMMTYEPPLDPGIRCYVEALNESGDRWEGFLALSVALRQGFPVAELRRIWWVEDGDPVSPAWEMTFSRKASE
jgi:hypothetical protein